MVQSIVWALLDSELLAGCQALLQLHSNEEECSPVRSNHLTQTQIYAKTQVIKLKRLLTSTSTSTSTSTNVKRQFCPSPAATVQLLRVQVSAKIWVPPLTAHHPVKSHSQTTTTIPHMMEFEKSGKAQVLCSVSTPFSCCHKRCFCKWTRALLLSLVLFLAVGLSLSLLGFSVSAPLDTLNHSCNMLLILQSIFHNHLPTNSLALRKNSALPRHISPAPNSRTPQSQ